MGNSFVTRGVGRDLDQGSGHAVLVPIRPVSLEDEALREEIELLLDVIATATDCPGHLTTEQVDAALRLPTRGRGRPWCDAQSAVSWQEADLRQAGAGSGDERDVEGEPCTGTMESIGGFCAAGLVSAQPVARDGG